MGTGHNADSGLNMKRKMLNSNLEKVGKELVGCTRCPLHATRTNIVVGEGNSAASVVFVGEGPGADEDAQGRPFVGRAGRVLNSLLEAVGLDRAEVYIANIVKCRPPGNRPPAAPEVAACLPFLEAQLEALAPKVIVPLGRVPAGILLETDKPLGKMRGIVHNRRGVAVVPTYHPSFLLRNGGAGPRFDQARTDLELAMEQRSVSVR